MKTLLPKDKPYAAGFDLIIEGLWLAFLGATSVAFLVLGISYLYTARFTWALGDLTFFAIGLAVFSGRYGPYLDRLEGRMSGDIDMEMPAVQENFTPSGEVIPEAATDQPLSAHIMIAITTAAYGGVVIVGGLIWTQGQNLLLNCIAGGALIISAGLAWRFGRGTPGS